MEKKKVSGFEYAIAQIAAKIKNDPSIVENLEPLTREEELQQRHDNLMEQTSKMRIKHEE